jgi:hypothetical protein
MSIETRHPTLPRSSKSARYQVIAIMAMTILLTTLSVAQEAQRDAEPTLGHSQVIEFDPNDLADKIISGIISEKQFRKLLLTDEQVTEVFRHIGLKRQWTISEEALVEIGRNRGHIAPNTSSDLSLATTGACIQDVELQNGSNNFVYPIGVFRPRAGEACGSGSGDRLLFDRVLEYRPRNAPANANNVKWWSNSWFVRWVLNNPPPTGFRGRLTASGLCSNRIRVCIGFRALTQLGPWDLQTIYLWWN